MKIDTEEQANSINLGDASVIGILWQNDSRDLALHLELNSGAVGILTCIWFTNLRIDLDFKELSESLTWDVRFTRSDKQIWHVEFDFAGAPDGVLELDCNDMTFEETNCER